MPKVTKPKLKIWEYFEFNDENKSYLCKFCETSYKKNGTRMANHLKKCLKIPISVLKRINNENWNHEVMDETRNNSG